MDQKFLIRYLLLFTVILCGFFLQAQIIVQKVKPDLSLTDKQGVFYALPLTAIRVDLKVKKTEYYAGPYAEYASKYLDLEGVITNDYNDYSITDLKLNSIAVPDPDNYYFAEIDEKAIKENKAVIFSMSGSGLMLGLNGGIPAADFNEFRDKTIASTGQDKNLFNYFAESNLYETYDTIIQLVVVDTVRVEKVHLERKWVEKSTEQKAVEAANMISKIRESRFNLLTGYQEVAYEGSSITYMDKEMKKLEKEYLSLFTGISIEKELTYTFTVIPDPEEQPNQVPVFVFSDRTGVKEANAAGGEKISIHIERMGNTENISKLTASREQSSKSGRGFYYRIPQSTLVSISIGNDLKVEKLIPICQYGSVSYLPSMITVAQFHPETGAVSKLVIE
ncbi:MAG: DUF4831 family protein [Bacteroidales bacterium]|nr:DUF4831 family protein [Bacteroidales bacterium]